MMLKVSNIFIFCLAPFQLNIKQRSSNWQKTFENWSNYWGKTIVGNKYDLVIYFSEMLLWLLIMAVPCFCWFCSTRPTSTKDKRLIWFKQRSWQCNVLPKP